MGGTISLRKETCDRLIGLGAFDALGEFFASSAALRSQIEGEAEYVICRDSKTGEFFGVDEVTVRPMPTGNGDQLTIVSIPDVGSGSPPEFSYRVRVADLNDCLHHHWVYRIGLHPASADADRLMSHPSFRVFRNGYFGITSGQPLERFKQHCHKVEIGEGFLLHRAWRALADETTIQPSLTVIAGCRTRDDALDLEEYLRSCPA